MTDDRDGNAAAPPIGAPPDESPGGPRDEGPELTSLGSMTVAHGALVPGRGLVSGVVGFAFAVMALLGVIGFHFPAYLSTPEFRAVYDVTTLRYIMAGGMVIAGAIAIVNGVFGRTRWLAAWTFAILVVAQLLGGPTTPIPDFPDNTPYLGLDFLILDLLGSTLVFVLIEKVRPLRKDQPVFRPEWQNDLTHFFFNHLVVGFVLLITNRVVHDGLGWAANDGVRGFIAGLPFLLQLFLVVLVADLVQYAAHRSYHEVGFLWRFHGVHHSAKHMDWLAGSRQHILELILTRILVLSPIFLLGFSQRVIDAYVIIVGFQAVFNHCNVNVRLGPLRYILVTPNFHHWHHSRDTEAVDKNYAAHFAFIDYLFGTAVKADRMWPDRYGVIGDYMPLGFLKQQAFPFVGSTESRERSLLPPESHAWQPPGKSD